MGEPRQVISHQAVAALHEVLQALTVLAERGESHTLFIDKMALTPEDRQDIRDYLGTGAIHIHFKGTSEPVEWQESGMSGVWYGVFYNQSGQPILETLEIAYFPGLAAAQPDDLQKGVAVLRERLTLNNAG